MTNEDLVSAIIPTFNRPSLLNRAIKSVINQTYKNLEIIVVDDASKVDNKKVIDSFHDDRIVFLKHDVNKGISASRNTGIKHAIGKYVAFLDDDDEWFDRKTELQLSDLKCKGGKYQASYCKRENYDDELKRVVKYSLPGQDGNQLERLLTGNFITAPSVITERRCFDEVGGFDEEMRIAEDWEMWIRFSELFSFAYIDELLVRCHIHKDGRLSNILDVNEPNYLARIYRRHANDYNKYRKAHSQFLMKCGYASARNGNLQEARKFFLKSIAINPIKFEHIVAMVKTFEKPPRTQVLNEIYLRYQV